MASEAEEKMLQKITVKQQDAGPNHEKNKSSDNHIYYKTKVMTDNHIYYKTKVVTDNHIYYKTKVVTIIYIIKQK